MLLWSVKFFACISKCLTVNFVISFSVLIRIPSAMAQHSDLMTLLPETYSHEIVNCAWLDESSPFFKAEIRTNFTPETFDNWLHDFQVCIAY